MPELIYREVPQSDYDRVAAISGHAFHSPLKEMREWLDSPGRASTVRGLYESGRLVTCFEIYPLQMMTGGGTIACGGIGGLATPPEDRRRGYTGATLRHVVDELRSQGTALCLLGPFKESFYRRYGWASCMERRFYSGSPELFSSFQLGPGQFVRVGPEATPELETIYNGALRGRFGPLVRNQYWWNNSIWQRESNHTYLWRDETGVARAYLSYRFENSPEGKIMRCNEIIALDPVARAQLFAFLYNHDSQCVEISFGAPADAPVNLLLPDPLKCEVQLSFMLRLLDIEQALTARPYPSGSTGRLTIAVTDDWLSHNQGVFALEVADGKAHCSRLADDHKADLACDVRVLTQCYTRYLKPRTAAAFGMLEVRQRPALALLDTLCSGLAPYCLDEF